ncbi:SPOR domain-containing protein [Hydrogenophaga sp. BPS33]|uniref:SPOR domain-containing protein n=1 Tax=Hydrogenophaga sp. BPS33 TaxID=2651974 RepID=UPI001F1BF038|nr:SPOR domain-containing protein [Hydrogenophaga sp. BPS33]
MPATPPTAAQAPESATTALYRAALGPVNIARYLAVFERFDEAGRTSPAWNAAAGLLTVNWMVFRQLWGAALAYVACVGALLLLILGLGRHILQWPAAVEWGLLVALGLLSILIPGAYGNAILHADARRRITHAVRAAKTVREACAALEEKASTARRRWGLALLNGLALAAVLVGSAVWDLPWRKPVVDRNTVTLASPPAVAEPVAAADAVIESAVAPSKSPPPPTPEPPSPVVQTQAPSTPEPSSAPEPAPRAATAPTRAPAAPAAQAHGINVGLFADKANAERAQARLVEAGIPAILQTVDSPRGELTRVRVGPFGNRAQADDMAARIRALGLDAVVFRP